MDLAELTQSLLPADPRTPVRRQQNHSTPHGLPQLGEDSAQHA